MRFTTKTLYIAKRGTQIPSNSKKTCLQSNHCSHLQFVASQQSLSESKESTVEYKNGASRHISFIGTIKIACCGVNACSESSIWNFKMARRTEKLILMAFDPKVECPHNVSAVNWNMSMGFKEQTQKIHESKVYDKLKLSSNIWVRLFMGSNGEQPIH